MRSLAQRLADDGFPSLLSFAADTPNRGTGYGHAEALVTAARTFVARKACGCAVWTFVPNLENEPILTRAVARLRARGGWVEPVRGETPEACDGHKDGPWRAVGS